MKQPLRALVSSPAHLAILLGMARGSAGARGLKLPKSAHTFRPWRVHALAEDFELEDVWRLPTPGGPDDLARLVRQIATPGEDPFIVRALFALRWKLGKFLGWERPDSGVGERVRSLRERLPPDLLAASRGPDLRAVPGREAADGPPIFSSVYQTHDEWVAEFANKTVHSLMHIGWVPDDSGDGYHAQMAVLVKPNGWAGKAYMAAIKPFRYAVVYPLLLRSLGRQWKADGLTTPRGRVRQASHRQDRLKGRSGMRELESELVALRGALVLGVLCVVPLALWVVRPRSTRSSTAATRP